MNNTLQAYSELYEYFTSKAESCDLQLFHNDTGKRDYKANYYRIMHSEIDQTINELVNMLAKLQKNEKK